MSEPSVDSCIQCVPAPAWISCVAATIAACLSVWTASASIGFFRRGLQGDTAAAICTSIMTLLLAAACFILIRRSRRKGSVLSTSLATRKGLSFLSIPIAAVTIWGAACYFWDTFLFLNRHDLHLIDFDPSNRLEGSSLFSRMTLSILGGFTFGTVGVFLSWFAFRTLMNRRTAVRSADGDQSNPYSAPSWKAEKGTPLNSHD